MEKISLISQNGTLITVTKKSYDLLTPDRKAKFQQLSDPVKVEIPQDVVEYLNNPDLKDTPVKDSLKKGRLIPMEELSDSLDKSQEEIKGVKEIWEKLNQTEKVRVFEILKEELKEVPEVQEAPKEEIKVTKEEIPEPEVIQEKTKIDVPNFAKKMQEYNKTKIKVMKVSPKILERQEWRKELNEAGIKTSPKATYNEIKEVYNDYQKQKNRKV